MSDGGRHALESKVAAYVYHDNDPAVPRPTGTFGSVVWVGDVEPTNWQDGDIWESVGEAISTQHSHAGGPPIVVKSDLETFTDITTDTIVGGPTVNIPTGYALVQAVIHWNVSAVTTVDSPNMQIFLTLSGANTGTTIDTERAWVRAAVARQGTGVRGAHVLTFLPGELEPGMTDFEATFAPSSVTWSGTSRVTIMVWPGSDIHEANQVGVTGLREIITYTENGAFVKANYPWLRAVRAKVQGGGGGGGSASANASGRYAGPGGGGAYVERLFAVGELGPSETVTVGAGGAGGGDTVEESGSSGGSSSFGSHITAGGGGAGGQGTTTGGDRHGPGGGSGGNPAGVYDLGIRGQAGQGEHQSSVTALSPLGGSSHLGHCPGQSRTTSIAPGADGAGYGSGGGGGASCGGTGFVSGGKGADGVVILELYG